MVSARVQRTIRNLERFTQRGGRLLISAVDRNLRGNTPRDTGYAAASLKVKVGSPDRSGPTTRPYPRDVAILQARQLFRRNRANALRIAQTWKPGQRVFFTWNLVYVPILDTGSSPQAQAGWIQDTIQQSIADARSGLRARFR